MKEAKRRKYFTLLNENRAEMGVLRRRLFKSCKSDLSFLLKNE